MDNEKLRAELDKLAQLATEKHEAANYANRSFYNLVMSEVRGILQAIHQIGLICDPPLEVVSQGPRYVVREKRGVQELTRAAFYPERG